MKVLMIAPTPFFADRGCHVRIMAEVRALQLRGHEVVVSTYALGQDVPGIHTVRTVSVPWYRKLSAGPSWHKYYIDCLLLGLTNYWIRRWRPDVLHAHLHEGAFVGALARGRRHIPLILDYQGSLVDETTAHRFTRPGTFHYGCLNRVERWVERRVDAIICNTLANVDRLKQLHTELDGRLYLLADSVDTHLFRPDVDGGQVRQRLGLPRDIPLIVYAGLLSDHQGVGLLLEALARLREGRRFHALLIGYPNEEHYKGVALGLGLEGDVTFAGRLGFQELPSHLAAADLAVSAKLPSSEGNGKLCVYLATGLPVVAFDTPVNREIAGNDAILVSPVTADALSQGMEKVLDSPLLQRSIRERARRRAVTHLSDEAVGDALCNIYANVRRAA